MSERCAGGTTFTTDATIDEIEVVFPDAIQLSMLNRNDEKPGVYIVADDDIRILQMVGPCPNFVKGECSFGAPCPINSLIFRE